MEKYGKEKTRPKTGLLLAGGYLCKNTGPIQKVDWLRSGDADSFLYNKKDVEERGVGLLNTFVTPALQEGFSQLILDMAITVNKKEKLELASDISVFFLLEGMPWKYATHISTVRLHEDLIQIGAVGILQPRVWDRVWFMGKVLSDLASTFTKNFVTYKKLKKKGRAGVNELYQKLFEIHLISSYILRT